MTTDEFSGLFSVDDEERRNHPMRTAQAAMRKPLPKRFYKEAGFAEEPGGFRLTLDGRGALTPKRASLLLPNAASAALVAAEWNAQQEIIDPGRMHATRMVNAALDHVALAMVELRDDAARYFGTDLICYRASEPERLVALQDEHWTPLARWIEQRLNVALKIGEGIIFTPQEEDAILAYRQALDAITHPIALAAFHVMLTLSGSATIALAVAETHIEPLAAFAASELDADFTAEVWGVDDEAMVRRHYREGEFLAAASLYRAVG